jgi:acetyl esterase
MSLRYKIERAAARALLALPPRLLQILSGGRTVRRGRELDPRLQMGAFLARIKPSLETLPPERARPFYVETVAIFDLEFVRPARFETLEFQGPRGVRLRARLYAPAGNKRNPCLIYFHGGGFVIGDLGSYDAALADLANAGGFAVLSIDYRLAPEHKLPAAHDDVVAALAWFKTNAASLGLDAARYALGGDSAGGNLAIHAARNATRLRLAPPRALWLLYPWLDLSQSRASVQEFGRGYALTAPILEYFKGHALARREQALETRISPALLTDRELKSLPPVLMQLAGFDPLQDEQFEFLERLRRLGAKPESQLYEGLMHGFVNLGRAAPAARSALGLAAQRLQKSFVSAARSGRRR